MEHQDPQEKCLLFQLPPELRNHIYSLVFALPLTYRGTLEIISTHERSNTPTVLSLLQTCRAIRDEAEGLFFSTYNLELRQNRGSIPDLHTGLRVGRFVRRLSVRRLETIREITLVGGSLESFASGLRSLRRVPKLRVLTLWIRDVEASRWRRESKRETAIMIEDVRRLPRSLEEIKVGGTQYCCALHQQSESVDTEWMEQLSADLNRALEERKSMKVAA